jgi:hypothetical protein
MEILAQRVLDGRRQSWSNSFVSVDLYLNASARL